MFNSNLTSYKYCTMKFFMLNIMNLQIAWADNVSQMGNDLTPLFCVIYAIIFMRYFVGPNYRTTM